MKEKTRGNPPRNSLKCALEKRKTKEARMPKNAENPT